MVRGGVIERLDVVIDRDGDCAGGSGDVSADHEYDAEFAERVREREREAGNQTRNRKRQNHATEGLPLGGAERG